MAREPRIDEQEALDVICALEDVEGHVWLCPGSKPTPDLEVVIDGDLVTVEVTMHTSSKEQQLWGAAEKMRSPERSGGWPQRTCELSHKWKVVVSDHSLESRDRSRPLKELVKALIPVLATVESTGASPEVMHQRANEILNPDPYNPNQPGPEYSGYWYSPDVADWVTEGRHPRIVMVLGPPRAVQAGRGGVAVYVTTTQSCFVEALNDLVPAIQAAIDHKADRGQLANVPGEKWLVVALDGGNASMQLEELCSRATHPPSAEFDSVVFPDFDEVWVFCRTFVGDHHAVLRLSRSDLARFSMVPRTANASQT